MLADNTKKAAELIVDTCWPMLFENIDPPNSREKDLMVIGAMMALMVSRWTKESQDGKTDKD